MSSLLRYSALFGCVLMLGGACGSDEPFGAADSSLPEPDAGSDTKLPDTGATPDAKAIKREVSTRVPFGNVQNPNNLLWDGDFEWHNPFAQQYGWVHVTLLVQPSGFDQIRVGAACRSGMKCGFISQNQRIAAIGVAPSDAPVSAAVWVKPPTDCSDVSVQLFACDYGGDPDEPLVHEGGNPDRDGWCRFTGVVPEREHATCLGVSARFSAGEAIVDDALVESAPPGARLIFNRRPATLEDRADADAMRRFLRSWLKPGYRPKSRALVAFERWRERPR